MSGTKIDYAAYKEWLSGASLPIPAAPEPQSEFAKQVHSSVPDNSAIAHPVPDASDPSPQTSSPGGGTPDAPYPTSFAHIVELITTGQLIPGIREIPNTLNSALPSEAVKPKRPKPWEKRRAEEGNAGLPT
jgi:hypothetical protein